MNIRPLTAVAMIALLAASTNLSLAADPTEAGRNLPAICKSTEAGGMEMGGMTSGSTGGMDPAHQDLMKGMSDMNAHMNEGMSAKNIDVAFVCGMIPHHQGAIDMAKAELAHGSDPWAKAFAQSVVDAQTKEIADMLDWLTKQPK